MAGVRGRKSRRQRTVDPTRSRRKKKKIVKPAIGSKELRKHWNPKKTLQQNLRNLGLAYDPNNVLKDKPKKLEIGEDAAMDVEKDAPLEEEPVNMAVITEFERQAAAGVTKERHISEGEAKFLMALIKDHNTNYRAMARDKRNTYQHTDSQLRRKCEALKRSSQFAKYEQLFQDLKRDMVVETRE